LASGTTRGTTNQRSHCSGTAITPGHSRRSFRGAGSIDAKAALHAGPRDPFRPACLVQTAPEDPGFEPG
jgi:hypothetical protein